MGENYNMTKKEIIEKYESIFFNMFRLIIELDYEKNDKETIKEVMLEIYHITVKELYEIRKGVIKDVK